MSGEGKMSTTIKNVSSERADGDLRAEKGQLAVFEDASH
jgi:hypothetical protein